jgi:ATP-dependent Clp protease ATP-binding subunit ClpA
LLQQGVTRLDILNYISHGISKIDTGGPFSEPFDDEEFAGIGPAERRKPLESFTDELVERARLGQIDPIVGRTAEIERTIQVLCRRKKNKPLYVGEPGVGKTALAEGLRLKISEGDVPEVLKDAKSLRSTWEPFLPGRATAAISSSVSKRSSTS